MAYVKFKGGKFKSDPKPTPTPKKPKKRIKQVSEKHKKALKLYGVLNKVFLSENPLCQVKLKGCFGKASEVHHDSGRGSKLNDVSTFVAICRNCHNIVEEKNIKVL